MSRVLKPYSDYKDSGVRWLGMIPKHWKQNALWTLTNLRAERNPGSLPLLSVFLDRGVIPYGEGGGQVHAPSLDLSKYQVVCPGDFVLNNQQAWRGSVGVSRYHGIISPAYIVLRISAQLDSVFANYLFRSPSMVDQFVVASKGVGDIQRQIYWLYLKKVQVVVPNADEQAAIVQFLNFSNYRIDRYIRAKNKVIKLLNEQKQAVIQRAVTLGIDSAVTLKPSGADWLGNVPSHWDVLRSRFIFREIDKRSTTGNETHLSMSQKLGLVPSSMIEERRLMSESYVGAKICEKDDIVLNRLKAHLGVFALAPQQGLVSPDYTIFRAIRRINPRYFELLLRTPACRVELRKRAKGIVQGFWRLYTDDFYDIRLTVPPIEEQNVIVSYLDDELQELNRAIKKVNDEVKLIREYRTRLISDVVTGKLDVREAAKKLPEIETLETTESELSEEDELSDELEEAEEMSNADE